MYELAASQGRVATETLGPNSKLSMSEGMRLEFCMQAAGRSPSPVREFTLWEGANCSRDSDGWIHAG